MSDIKCIKEHWVDKNNNRWDVSRHKLKDMIKISESLKNCYNCYNCYECVDCIDCVGCRNCHEC